MLSGRRNSVSLGGRQIKKDITTNDPKRTKFRIIDLREPSFRFRVKCSSTDPSHELKYQGTSMTIILWFPFSKSKAFNHAGADYAASNDTNVAPPALEPARRS